MLEDILRKNGADTETTNKILASGYYLRTFVDPFSGRMRESISDLLYGNKQSSSMFDPAAFVAYARGEDNPFAALPEFQTFVVKTRDDIDEVLSEPRRQHYLQEGSLTFRGQPTEYSLKRILPNPVRSNKLGEELSILPGAYRQKQSPYAFDVETVEQRIVQYLPPEMLGGDGPMDSLYTYDSMRVEQHYATQTCGLDLTFDIDVALFFATHRFRMGDDSKASYESISIGANSGVIYAFRFCNPSVKSESFIIREFDLFKNQTPERVLRQNCGLPLFGAHERNIAITDLDCIIRLHSEFVHDRKRSPEYLFPSVNDDKFYATLLEQKDKHPEPLRFVVEYSWAR